MKALLIKHNRHKIIVVNEPFEHNDLTFNLHGSDLCRVTQIESRNKSNRENFLYTPLRLEFPSYSYDQLGETDLFTGVINFERRVIASDNLSYGVAPIDFSEINYNDFVEKDWTNLALSIQRDLEFKKPASFAEETEIIANKIKEIYRNINVFEIEIQPPNTRGSLKPVKILKVYK